jgi:hypothetical protein
MKFSRDHWILVILVLALLGAMVITLWVGGSRSRHGYGFLSPEPKAQSIAATPYGQHLRRSFDKPTVAHFNQKGKHVPMLKS